MAPEHNPPKRLGQKLKKRRKPMRSASMEYPERLREGDDVHEDVTAPKGPKGHSALTMNQSVFSMIAAAGSKVDFHARFEGGSSDSEDDEEETSNRLFAPGGHSPNATPDARPGMQSDETIGRTKSRRQLGKSLEGRGFRRLPQLNLQTIKEKNYMSQSAWLPSGEASPPQESPRGITPRDAPVMSKMLEAQAVLSSSTEGLDTNKESPREDEDMSSPTSLRTRLMQIFGFESPEEVISEYPCWLLQSVLLQGYMYITQNHICFYAYLAKKSNIIAKSGNLSKRGRYNPKYNRYWFTLKGDVLSYYTNSSDTYFPSGDIDLRYGISASLVHPKEKGKDTRDFSVVTNQRVYHFKADSAPSAKEWVKTLQKVIFRSHNDGDSVKISLPIENVIDIEQSPVIPFAETFKISVVHSDDTYAVDEYFFTFFSFGQDALNVLRSMVDDTTAQKIPQDFLSSSPANEESRSRDSSRIPRSRKRYDLRGDSPVDSGTPVLHENVRTTLVPFSPTGSGQASPRASGDWGRRSMDVGRRSMDLSTRDFSRASFDQGRRTASESRTRLTKAQEEPKDSSIAPQASTDSFVHSLEQGTESSGPNVSSNETHASGSQILDRSDVFQSPTIHRLQKHPPRPKIEKRGHSFDDERRDTGIAHIKLRPPSRSHTDQSVPDNQQVSDIKPSELAHASSSPTLQQLVKAGAYPLQRAAGFAGYLRSRSKRMSNLLATESMGYVEKVSGMWAGGRRHYGEREGVVPEDKLDDLEEEGDPANYGDNFRAHFALPESEKLQATYFGLLHRVLPLYGKIYIGNKKFCFRSTLPGTKTKLVLPIKDIENVNKDFRFGYPALVIVIRGHEELFFHFYQSEDRDDCAVTLLEILETMTYLDESGLLTQEDKDEAETAKAEHQLLQEARHDGLHEHGKIIQASAQETTLPHDSPTLTFDDPRASILNFKPTESLRITCLTIGSRGDVQPYIALCKGLLADGHKPKIATHAEFEEWVRKHGIDFAPIDGDPAELMRICVEHGMFTYSFLREASSKFRGWIDGLLTTAWKACQGSDILIESPSTMAGIHVAEALKIPYFRAFTMPWTRTKTYPHAFAVPERKLGGNYNKMTYVMVDNIFWKATAGQINHWRRHELGLRNTTLHQMQPNKVPFLYNFSPHVVPPPNDFRDWIHVTGYWFLDEGSTWTPSVALTDFIAKARADKKKIVYIGFGSITVPDSAALTKTVVGAVSKADVRCILSKGWSDRLDKKDATIPEVSLPSNIFQITSAPHDWLFKQIDAACHHGGAGTTGASLRAGIPTVVRPFFGDQYFYGTRVEDLGVGIYVRKTNTTTLGKALWEATNSERLINKARALGEQIRKEHGVATAIQAIYRDLEYAKSQIKRRVHLADLNDGGGYNQEESWTMIGDEDDPELQRCIVEWEPRKSFQIGERRGRQSIDLGA